MAPKLSLVYSDGGVNGPVGVGWSVQGLSMITRCPWTFAHDGTVRAVHFDRHDRLCLDGQRLILTDANGSPLAPQNIDAGGLPAGAVREYRTEKDSFARIRAYGMANDTDSGPKRFRVWTKSGLIYDYGQLDDEVANGIQRKAQVPVALTLAPNVTPVPARVSVWAVARISDTVGNYVDFKYKRNSPTDAGATWGSSNSAAGDFGQEWNIDEILYTGRPGQLPYNKVKFIYGAGDRSETAQPGHDRGEAFQPVPGLGFSKNLSLSLLSEVRVWVNSPNPIESGPTAGATFVRGIKLAYERSPSTGRSRLTSVTECADLNATKCLPPTVLAYTNLLSPPAPAYPTYTRDTTFGSASGGLWTTKLHDKFGGYGTLTGDFNGDGKTDVLRWSNNIGENQLWLSSGSGQFQQITTNLTTYNLFHSNNCYYTIATDMNGDGLTDLLRVAKPTCSPNGNVLLVATGNGIFSPVALPSTIDLQQQKTTLDITYAPEGCNNPLQRTTLNEQVATRLLQSGARKSDPSFTTPTKPGTRDPAKSKDKAAPVPAQIQSTCTIYSRQEGRRFYLIDVDGDGLQDIVTTIAPHLYWQSGWGPVPSDGALCATLGVCSKVYRQLAAGGFQQVTPTTAEQIAFSLSSVYSHPDGTREFGYLDANPYWRRPAVADINGDGLQDILAEWTGRWRSLGNGSFVGSVNQDYSEICGTPIDFNGDGRQDCLFPGRPQEQQFLSRSIGAASSGAITQFNITESLHAQDTSARQTIGVVIDDFNGDGRHDILRWGQSATDNGIYYSLGNGAFSTRQESGLGAIAMPLQHVTGDALFVLGDFLGTGSNQILHMKHNPTATGDVVANTNQLYVRNGGSSVPDLLASVQSPTGLTTTVAARVPLTNSGGRYVSDRGTANAAASPLVDIQPPMLVITSLTQQTGAGNITTEYMYKGLKAERNGRGLLGFRETLQQNPAPDGTNLMTVRTSYLLRHPYDGVAWQTETYLSGLSGIGPGSLLSSTTNYYCDGTLSVNPDAFTDPSQPCSPSLGGSFAKVVRPYLRKSVETGKDLVQKQLPTVTTVNTFNSFGDPTHIEVTTVGEVAGINRTYVRRTINDFCGPDIGDANCANKISGDNWIIGRLRSAKVWNTVPDLRGLGTSAGSSPTATAVVGTVPAVPVTHASPAVIEFLMGAN